jgi:hypothetical protein
MFDLEAEVKLCSSIFQTSRHGAKSLRARV